MALGERRREEQGELWIPSGSLVKGPGHPFYAKLDAVLAEERFDEHVEERCREYYAPVMGRPGIAPGVYFRMLLVGFLERLESERAIAWRCQDSLSLREFLGYRIDEEAPDHSSLSRIRARLSLEVHEEVFGWVLAVLGRRGLIDGKTVGVDSTTLEANAALRSIVRRDSGESYEEFLTRLAKESGIETPTRSDLARVDRKRKNKGSNDDWVNPNDPDAEIAKMKDGHTDMGHKLEQAVDLSGEGAVLAVTLHGGASGDTENLAETLSVADENLEELREDDEAAAELHEAAGSEVVADKGYHSNEVLTDLEQQGKRSYVSEPDRGRRRWDGKPEEQQAVYANRRRVRGERGKRLLRSRGELLERPFAHYLEAGGMRRTHLRGHAKIMKRLLIHVAGFNLGLLMRSLVGWGTPKQYAEAAAALLRSLWRLVEHVWRPEGRPGRFAAGNHPIPGAPIKNSLALLYRAA
jgi:transposase